MSDPAESSNNRASGELVILPQPELIASSEEVTLANPHDSTNLVGKNKLGRFRKDPLGFLVRLMAESSAFYTGSGWRGYENYIGARIFYPEYSTEIRTALLRSERVREMVGVLARKKVQAQQQAAASSPKIQKSKSSAVVKAKDPLVDAENETWKVVGPLIDSLIAMLDSMRVIRFVAFTMNNVLVRMYHQGIHINEAEYLRLRKWAQIAEQNKQSLIFLPCHKSHIDYLVISYILYRLGIALPHIAAGENLNMPVVGTMLQYSGAFFIRRVWGDDLMYNTVMRDYIELLLTRGHNLEAFIEGTRSRIGKLLQPKLGILKIILESILAGRVKDCIVVPMSIGYDRVIESESYVSELLGTPKEKESLFQLLNSMNILQFKWGRIDVRFGEPYYLKKYVTDHCARRGSGFDPVSNPAHKNLLLQSFGYQILSDINHISVVMPTALVGTILLTLRGRGVGRDELIRKVNWLRRNVIFKGGQVADFGGNSTGWVVDRAIQVLRDLVGKRTDLLEPVYYPVKRFELCLYRNQVIHLFINEAILSTAMYATVKAGGPVHSQKILIYPNLEGDVSFLSSLLKSEFIYGPGGLHDNLEETIEKMVALDVFSVQETLGVEAQRFITLSAEERRIGRETFDFYCFLLWPFVETYWLAAISCFALIPENLDQTEPVWMDDRVFTDKAQFLGKTLYYEGDLSYFESVNKETMKNAFLRLRDLGVISYRKGPGPNASGKKDSNITWVSLNLEWYPRAPMPSPPPSVSVRESDEAAAKAAQVAAPEVEKQPSSFAIRHNDHDTITGHARSESGSKSKLSEPEGNYGDDELLAKKQYLNQDDDDDDDDTSSKARKQYIGNEDWCPEEDYFEPWNKHRPDGRLWEFCEQIGRFRREGKNRRDTATVASRVLMLATATRVLVVEGSTPKSFNWRGGRKASSTSSSKL